MPFADPKRAARYRRLYRIRNRQRIKSEQHAWYMKHATTLKRAARVYRLRTHYGLTEKQWEDLAIKQGGRCAICKKFRFLFVDHSHSTRRVRGLLCNTCNRALGLFRDSSKLLKEALRYVRND